MTRIFGYLALALAGCVGKQINNPSKLNAMESNDNNSSKPVVVKLITLGSARADIKKSTIENVTARLVAFRSRRDNYLMLRIQNPYTGKINFFPDGCDFLIADSGVITWVRLDLGGSLSLAKSFFTTSDAEEETSIAQFRAKVGGDTSDWLLQYNVDMVSLIDLSHAAPFVFFTAGSLGGSQPGQAKITGIETIDKTLRLDLLSDGDVFNGTFWIDIENKKVVKSIVDGQEMEIRPGQIYSTPKK